jgi:hypothetical protein
LEPFTGNGHGCIQLKDFLEERKTMKNQSIVFQLEDVATQGNACFIQIGEFPTKPDI